MSSIRFLTLLGAILLGCNAFAQIPSEGLTAFYPFNSNANDIVNGNDGFVSDQVLSIADRFGTPYSAMGFNGEEDQFIFIYSSTDFDPSETDSTISVSFWYKGGREDPSGLEHLVKREGYNGGYGVGILSSDTPLMFNFSSNISVEEDQADFPSGEIWHHIVGVFQKSNWRLYFNGVHQNTYPVYGPQTINTNLDEMLFGKNFIGGLDDIAFYRRALTEADVIDLFEADSSVVSIAENVSELNNQITVYPNPLNDDNLNISLGPKLQLTKVIVTNLAGEQVFIQSASTNNNLFTFNLASLAQGLYLVQIHTDKGLLTKKLVK